MPVMITINGENAAQAIAELMGLSAGVSGTLPAAPTGTVYAEAVPDEERKAFPEVKPKRTVKTKPVELEEVAVPEVAAEIASATAQAKTELAEANPDVEDVLGDEHGNSIDGGPVDEAQAARVAEKLNAEKTDAKPEFSEDDVRKALVDLGSQANGKENCRAVLTQFGATKISEVKVEDRKAFIAAIAKLRGVA